MFFWILGGVFGIFFLIFLWDRFFQTKNLVVGNYPVIGRFRYFFHKLRPFFRQYFGDDNAYLPRVIVDWILKVAHGKSGYFAFDIFDSTGKLHDGNHQMRHSANPKNVDEIAPKFPTIGEKRKHPMKMKNFLYKSAMSLGAIGFEGTRAMASACEKVGAPFNTGEGGFAVHHIPNVKFSPEKKFFKSVKIPKLFKVFLFFAPGARLKNRAIDFLGNLFLPCGMRDLWLFDKKYFCFYTINWDAPLSDFPEKISDGAGQIIFQIGSGLYGLRDPHDPKKFNFDRFQKIMRFCAAIEIKLAQGAKQTGGVLKAVKNTPVIAEIRGVKAGIDLISPNRFPFYEKDGEKEFFEFLELLSEKAGGKPIGIKIVISSEKNIEPIAREMERNPRVGPDFITIDGGDGGSGAAPVALGILFGKKIEKALETAISVLKKYRVRNRVKVFASAKLAAPHQSARALAIGADAIGEARAVMIAGGCIRSGFCSGENGDCPVGLATMKRSKRRGYEQSFSEKVKNIENYFRAHEHGLEQIAAICGVDSPSRLLPEHLAEK